jgi:hypothetical protein
MDNLNHVQLPRGLTGHMYGQCPFSTYRIMSDSLSREPDARAMADTSSKEPR